MSDPLTALLATLIFGTLLFAMAMVVRFRGPQGLVKGVDWTRVSDIQGFGQFVSLIVTIIAALNVAQGVARYVLRDEPALRNIATIVFVTLIALFTLTLVIGQLRYQDRPRRDGR
jgi:hypothetical protein